MGAKAARKMLMKLTPGKVWHSFVDEIEVERQSIFAHKRCT